MSTSSSFLGSEAFSGSVALDDFEVAVERLRQVKARAQYYRLLRGSLEAVLKARLGDREVGTLRGQPVITYRRSMRVSVSLSLLRARYPEAARDCEDIAEVRTFVLLG